MINIIKESKELIEEELHDGIHLYLFIFFSIVTLTIMSMIYLSKWFAIVGFILSFLLLLFQRYNYKNNKLEDI